MITKPYPLPHQDQDDEVDICGTVTSDLVFNLLYMIFLASLALVPKSAQQTLCRIDVKPAVVQQGAGVAADPMPIRAQVTINRDGSVLLNDQPLGPANACSETLVRRLRTLLAEPGRVQIIPAADAPWQAVVEANAAVKQATDTYETLAELNPSSNPKISKE
jgi:biopolymer transport protein ExbD